MPHRSEHALLLLGLMWVTFSVIVGPASAETPVVGVIAIDPQISTTVYAGSSCIGIAKRTDGGTQACTAFEANGNGAVTVDEVSGAMSSALNVPGPMRR